MNKIPTNAELLMAKQLRTVKCEDKDKDFCNCTYFDMQDKFTIKMKAMLYEMARKYNVPIPIKEMDSDDKKYPIIEELKADTSHLLWRAFYFNTEMIKYRKLRVTKNQHSAYQHKVDEITTIVCEYYNKNKDDVRFGDAKNGKAGIRKIISMLAAEQVSTVQIGNYFNKDHSTIHHNILNIRKKMKKNSELLNDYLTLHQKVYSKI